MNELKKEKEDLMKQVDVEEDHITNTLLKKLDAVGSWFLLWWIVTEGKSYLGAEIGIWTGMHGESSSTTDPGDSSWKDVGLLFWIHSRELRNRLRDDTQVLLRTIQQSIDLLQMARSASATPALE